MKENQKLYKIAKAIYSKLLKILYNPTTKGTKNIPEKGPIIIVGNHKHAFDPIMVMSNTNRTIHYMAKESLFKGIHGKILESIGTIKIHRNKSNPIAIKEAEEILKQGVAVGIFPEGNYKPFKKGLSIEFGKPINISHMEVEEANNYIRNEVLTILRK